MSLKFQWPFIWLLVFLIPLRDVWALPAAGGTLPQHLLWPLVHANIPHWLINTFCFMTLWRFVTFPRLTVAYITSILIGYLHTAVPAVLAVVAVASASANSSLFTLHSSLKLCGFSCIIFFLLGIIFMRCNRTYRLRLTLLIIISLFIPGIASFVHIAALLAGIIYHSLSRRLSFRTPYTITKPRISQDSDSAPRAS